MPTTAVPAASRVSTRRSLSSAPGRPLGWSAEGKGVEAPEPRFGPRPDVPAAGATWLGEGRTAGQSHTARRGEVLLTHGERGACGRSSRRVPPTPARDFAATLLVRPCPSRRLSFVVVGGASTGPTQPGAEPWHGVGHRMRGLTGNTGHRRPARAAPPVEDRPPTAPDSVPRRPGSRLRPASCRSPLTA